LLAFGRKQDIAPRPLNLNKTVRDTERLLQRLIGEDIVLTANLCPFLGQVSVDPDQIHRVIMNLAVNARDAMPDGGKLDIETTNVDLSEESAAMHSEAIAGPCVLMTITDTGHGMDDTIRQRIFEPFFTTKELGKGTGLGLATVYGIIRQSGGWLDVASEVGVGTSFKVYLPRIADCPLAEADEIPADTDEWPRAGAPTEGVKTIVLVEDQDSVRSFIKMTLERYGYHIIEASGGGEAIACAKQHSGPIHLLVTDVVLTGMNGREVSERLKELYPNLRVLFISGYTADVIASHGVLEPGVALLPKPFSPNELAAKIREVLADLS
jgi:two-component system, cell cycle sensor histidine kinase and response regulator CckA